MSTPKREVPAWLMVPEWVLAVTAVLLFFALVVELTGRYLSPAMVVIAVVVSLLRLRGPLAGGPPTHRCLALIGAVLVPIIAVMLLRQKYVDDLGVAAVASVYVGFSSGAEYLWHRRRGTGGPRIIILPSLLIGCVFLGDVTLVTRDSEWPRRLVRHVREIMKGEPSKSDGDAASDTVTLECQSVGEVKEWLHKNLPRAHGVFYDAWAHVGLPLIGCPAAYPRRAGEMWVVPLSKGKEGAALVGDSRSAAVVYDSDFRDVIISSIASFRRVEERTRWGLGTMQIVHTVHGSCSILQRYQSKTDIAYVLPPAVTNLASKLAFAQGAYPRIVQATGTNRRTYKVALLAPSSVGNGTREMLSIAIKYDASKRDATYGSRRERDENTCAAEVSALLGRGAALERSVQRRRAEARAAASDGNGATRGGGAPTPAAGL